MFNRVVGLWRRFVDRTSPQLLLIYTFGLLICIGTLALMMPFVQSKEVSIIDALFTATSATCVTGLATIDIASSFNWYGQFVILGLIQLGGVGLMTFAAISFTVLGGRISLGTRDILDNAFAIRDLANEFIKTFRLMFFVILSIEFIGAVFIFVGLIGSSNLKDSLWNAFFLSASSFCNAGFTLYSDSLQSTSVYTRSIIMVLIILGGLGHLVLAELYAFVKCLIQNKKILHPRIFSFHVRVVLLMTVLLLMIGTISTYLLNYRKDYIGLFESLFQSVTARTAGFSSVDQTLFSIPSILILILLMLVGGGAGSCAGGLKITTLAVWLAQVKSIITGSNEITLLGRKISNIIVTRVTKIIALAIFWNIFGLIVLSSFDESTPFLTLLFEQVSAFATVGLSLDFTDKMPDICRLWIIITMFVGRLGTLTIALAIPRSLPLNINHPEGRILVG